MTSSLPWTFWRSKTKTVTLQRRDPSALWLLNEGRLHTWIFWKSGLKQVAFLPVARFFWGKHEHKYHTLMLNKTSELSPPRRGGSQLASSWTLEWFVCSENAITQQPEQINGWLLYTPTANQHIRIKIVIEDSPFPLNISWRADCGKITGLDNIWWFNNVFSTENFVLLVLAVGIDPLKLASWNTDH